MKEQSCGSCKYFAQGVKCSFCANDNQEDVLNKKYVYYNFGTQCPLFEQGIHQSRVDYMKSLKKK